MRTITKLSAVIATLLAASVAVAQEQADERTRTAAAANANDSNQSQQSDGKAAVVPFITVLVPVAMESNADTGLAKGCWAKLYGQKEFKGDTLTLVGPVDMSDMRGPFGIQWDDKVNSIKAGPQATVTIYDNANFRDKAATVKSGEQVREISQKMGLFEDVESIRIRCASSNSSN